MGTHRRPRETGEGVPHPPSPPCCPPPHREASSGSPRLLLRASSLSTDGERPAGLGGFFPSTAALLHRFAFLRCQINCHRRRLKHHGGGSSNPGLSSRRRAPFLFGDLQAGGGAEASLCSGGGERGWAGGAPLAPPSSSPPGVRRAALPFHFPTFFASWRKLSLLERRGFCLSNIYCSREAKSYLPLNFARSCWTQSYKACLDRRAPAQRKGFQIFFEIFTCEPSKNFRLT